MLASVEVRNRLTHPKRQGDLEVTPEEVAAAAQGVRWFFGHLLIVLTQVLGVLDPGHKSEYDSRLDEMQKDVEPFLG